MKNWQRQYAENLIRIYKRNQIVWAVLGLISVVLLLISTILLDAWWLVDVLNIWNLSFSSAQYGRAKTLRRKAEDMLVFLNDDD